MEIIIETTRRCNLQCEHCMRGEAENMDIKSEYVDSLFSQLDQINSLTLTGGEPALNVAAINMIIDLAERHDLEIYEFYLATNGTISTDKFIMALIRLWLYCSENEISCVDVSNDIFHDYDRIQENIKKLQALSFVSFKHTTEKSEGYDGCRGVLYQGRGEQFNNDLHPPAMDLECFEGYPEDTQLYLNCHGDIIIGCDWSYENQPEHRLCHVYDLKKVLNSIPVC